MPLPTEEKSYERTSAKQMVYDKMKDWIIEGRLEAGEKIVSREGHDCDGDSEGSD